MFADPEECDDARSEKPPNPCASAVCAAALFGASAPLIKSALGSVKPIPLAGLLYLGSGGGLSVLTPVTRRSPENRPAEATLRAPDLPWVVGAILAGGITAPILLMFSLKVTQEATASLLLNFEGAATTAIAALMFREATRLRVWGEVALMTGACVVLSWDPAGPVSLSPGALGVLGACGLWGFDNNLT